jgi:hypothetical protein
MRRAFGACMAFMVLMVVVAVRCGFRHSPPAAPTHVIVDAAVADARIDDAAVVLDAAPVPNKHAPKPAPKPKPTRPLPKPTRPAPEPTRPVPEPTPTPVISTPVIPTPGRRQCTQPPNPAGCPATEPNVNRPCDAEGVQCVYGTSCCPFVYVCNKGAFEAWFTSCP